MCGLENTLRLIRGRDDTAPEVDPNYGLDRLKGRRPWVEPDILHEVTLR